MRVGVDFGTTRIVVAAADRGNYPVVSFETASGDSRDWFPPVVAVRDGERRYGFEAWDAQEERGWTVVRSVKRLLAQAGLGTRIEIGGQTIGIQTLLREQAMALCAAIRDRSTVRAPAGEPLELMLGVPANANSNQRFLTAEGFRQAGAHVVGLLNEPSAASVEFGHRARQAGDAVKHRLLLVYDFGGGTFDASLVELEDQVHAVLDSEGIASIGGDDFDELLAEMVLDEAGISPQARDEMTDAAVFTLYEMCRQHKEALHPNSRRIVIDLETVDPDWPPVTIRVADFYDRCTPLVERTFEAIDELIARQPESSASTPPRPDAVYVVGGGSELPIVGRRLRERYGRLVRRLSYSRSSTAIGLAIQADAQQGYVLRDRFTRYFGVWREADNGATAVFDPVFARGTALPGPGEPALFASRSYHPAHNLGHFRFLECTQLAAGGEPSGDILHWDEIRFPFTPALAGRPDLATVPVHHDRDAGWQEIVETFACDAGGSVVVTLENLTAGYSQRFPLGLWGSRTVPLKPGRRRKRR